MNLFKLFWSNPSGGVGGWLWRMVAGQGPERKCTDITGTEVACGGSDFMFQVVVLEFCFVYSVKKIKLLENTF